MPDFSHLRFVTVVLYDSFLIIPIMIVFLNSQLSSVPVSADERSHRSSETVLGVVPTVKRKF